MNNTLRSIKILTILTISIIFFCLIIVIYQFVKIGNLKTRQKEYTESLTYLQQQVFEYSSQIEEYSSRQEFLEEYARKVLNLSQHNQIWFTGN